MSTSILYMGDDDLGGAASYLAGVLTHHGLAFEHVPSDRSVPFDDLSGRRCLILSDYPARHFGKAGMSALVEQVIAGCGLLMIGGWESFSGAERQYTGSPIADVLPVELVDGDDRVNSAQPVLIDKVADHPIVDGLPWHRPPCVGGYNRFTARRDAQTILQLRHVAVERADDGYAFKQGATSPLLVTGQRGAGRVAALATDVAPHWVGGFVDWGDQRVDAAGPDAEPVQVGEWYARFFANLVAWVAGDL
jgi:hypothetical protein